MKAKEIAKGEIVSREASPEVHQYFKVVKKREDCLEVKEGKPGECGAWEANGGLTSRKQQ